VRDFLNCLIITLLLTIAPSTVLAGKSDALVDVLKALARGASEEAGKAIFRALLDNASAKKSNKTGTPPNVVAIDSGDMVPAPGYTWVHPDQATNFAVQWTAGKAHPAYDNVVASATVNQWNPASGYQWTSSAPDDFTVRRSDQLAANQQHQAGTVVNRDFRLRMGNADLAIRVPIPFLNVSDLFAQDTAELRKLLGANGISLLAWLVPDESIGAVLSGSEPEFSRQVMLITTANVEETAISQQQFSHFANQLRSLYKDRPDDVDAIVRNIFNSIQSNDSDLQQVALGSVTPLGLFHDVSNMICATNLSKLALDGIEIFNAASECWIHTANRILAASSTVFVDAVTPDALEASQELSRSVAAAIIDNN
jgi:hypothetical protein